jgi:myo-inositol 2-dehydrogenase/D-chiro-inositol 1-dehydrogenase
VKRKLNIALFGAGRMGQIHSSNLFLSEAVHLKYIVEQDEKIAKKIAVKFHCKTASLKEVFADESIDAVFITTPTPTHLEIIKEACKHKKNVFCEKPLASNLVQAKQIVKEVEKSKILFLTAFNRRFDPSFYKLKQQLDAGKIGELLHLTIFSRDPAPAPISYTRVSGGLVRDMMIHDLDMALGLLGESITKISAIGSNFFDKEIEEVGDIDHCCVMLQSQSGKIAQIVNSRYCSYGYDQRIEAFGVKGKLAVDNQKTTELELATKAGFQTDRSKLFFLERYDSAYKLELEHFCECLQTGEQPMISARDGMQAIALAEKIMQQLPQIKI